MRRRELFHLIGLAVVTLLVSGARSPAADNAPANDPHAMHAGHFQECAKACADCQRECDSCASHCAHLVAEGKKEHMKTLGTCTDCASICSTAARITARGGPLAGTVCEACAKACAACGAACDQVGGDDEHMKRCAEECRRCEKVCKGMLHMVGHDSDHSK